MLSKMKKSFIMWLSGILSLSLSFGTCASAYSNEDYKQMIVDYNNCIDSIRSCKEKCQKDKNKDTDSCICGSAIGCRVGRLANLTLTEKLKTWWDLRKISANDLGVTKEQRDVSLSGLIASFWETLLLPPLVLCSAVLGLVAWVIVDDFLKYNKYLDYRNRYEKNRLQESSYVTEHKTKCPRCENENYGNKFNSQPR